MNRLLFIFATFLLFFVFGYWLQSEFPETRLVKSKLTSHRLNEATTLLNADLGARSKSESLTLNDVVQQYSGQKKGKAEKKEILQPVSLEKSRGRELFVYLYSEHFRKNFALKQLEEVRNRFQTPLPRNFVNHVSMEQKEMANRLGILRAMETLPVHQMSEALQTDLGEFYTDILSNEKNHWLNRRQAYLNWKRVGTHRSEEKVKKQLAKVDPQVLSLATMSESEMIEALFE